MITGYTVPKIWCVPDVIVIFYFLSYFLSFHPTNSLKNENIKKLKTAPGDIIILH